MIDLSITPCGSELHVADLRLFTAHGIALPHEYTSWCAHETGGRWLWCHAARPGQATPLAFAMRLGRSRALPGTWIGRVERLGRGLHEAHHDVLGAALAEVARSVPRLQRLDVQVFDEDPARLTLLSEKLVTAGGQPLKHRRTYPRTLVVPLDVRDDEALLGALRPAARRRVRDYLRRPDCEVRPVVDRAYLDRLGELYRAPFARTGGTPPKLDFADVLADVAGGLSVLLGTFLAGHAPPADLVGFAWCRLHGDHVVYDAAGSERADELRRVPITYALMWEMFRWARERGAHWADLGGVIRKDAPDTHPAYGISHFKRRFSEDERVVSREFQFERRTFVAAAANATRRLASLIGIRAS